jgi:hypothetical protein
MKVDKSKSCFVKTNAYIGVVLKEQQNGVVANIRCRYTGRRAKGSFIPYILLEYIDSEEYQQLKENAISGIKNKKEQVEEFVVKYKDENEEYVYEDEVVKGTEEEILKEVKETLDNDEDVVYAEIFKLSLWKKIKKNIRVEYEEI